MGHAHCAGAELHAELRLPGGARVVRKGTNPETDSYSAFFDNTASGDTGLAASLRGAVTEVISSFSIRIFKYECLNPLKDIGL